jgi:single-stranded-DNA-specific exonuclease
MLAEAHFLDPRPMGEGRHLRFTVESRGARARGVSFGQGSRLPVAEGQPARATFALEVNEWNGVVEPRLRLRHAVAAAEPVAVAPIEPVAARISPDRASEPSERPERAEPEELVLF